MREPGRTMFQHVADVVRVATRFTMGDSDTALRRGAGKNGGEAQNNRSFAATRLPSGEAVAEIGPTATTLNGPVQLKANLAFRT